MLSQPFAKAIIHLQGLKQFLGPRGPLVLPLVGPVRPVRAKNLDHLYTGIYAL